MIVTVTVQVVHMSRRGEVAASPTSQMRCDPRSTEVMLEHAPPPVHVVEVTAPGGMWREEIHGGPEACRLFVRGVRAGARLGGAQVEVPIDWI